MDANRTTRRDERSLTHDGVLIRHLFRSKATTAFTVFMRVSGSECVGVRTVSLGGGAEAERRRSGRNASVEMLDARMNKCVCRNWRTVVCIGVHWHV